MRAKAPILLIVLLIALILGGCFWEKYSDPKNAVRVFGTWRLEGKVKSGSTSLNGTGTMKITYQNGNDLEGWGSTMPPGMDQVFKVDLLGTITDKPDNFLSVSMQVRYPLIGGEMRSVFLNGNVTVTATGTFVNNGLIFLDSLSRQIGEWTGKLSD
jgi:hypothetical protein